MIASQDRAEIRWADSSPPPVHPLGSRAKVLLASVFGPFGRDDEYGSRAANPMELYQNQVTRVEGPFSLRMFHRSWGLMLIQANIAAPCTVLDFPNLERFIAEIREHHYDVVGISAIPPNLLKLKKMCELVRRHLPQAVIVVGGHIANMPDLHSRIDADHIVQGEGVRWFRRFLGEDENQPIRHPLIDSGIGARTFGVTAKEQPGETAATLIPSVGCPMGCNFCSTSAMFGGKGKCIHFYQTGDELFDIMCQLEERMQVRSFFVMDENFLLHRKRALRLLELMQRDEKAWAICVFSSANALRLYPIEQLVRLGISWVWIGIEGHSSRYGKLHEADTFALVRQLQSHGIRMLGSTIIGLENHTPANIDEAIDYAVQHGTDFHQFMLYTPSLGTPLHAELSAQGLMKDESEYHLSDIHGQYIFNYRHPHIPAGQETEFLLRAFQRDFAENGPSIVRMVRTLLAGWQRYRQHPDPCIRSRFAWEVRELGTTYSAVVGACKLYYRNQPAMHAKMSALLRDLYREFGWKSRLFGEIGGRWLLRKVRQEEQRLAAGWTYEPPTFYEKNAACTDRPAAALCRYVTPRLAPAPLLPAVEIGETVTVG
jgi:hypothetical protein